MGVHLEGARSNEETIFRHFFYFIKFKSKIKLMCVFIELRDFPIEKFLELLQDYCVHLCLTCRHDGTSNNSSSLDGSPASLQERHHLLGSLQDRCDAAWDRGDLGCLYYSHSVVSAILSAKQLVGGAGMGGALKTGGGGTPRMAKSATMITLSKEDNSGGCG